MIRRMGRFASAFRIAACYFPREFHEALVDADSFEALPYAEDRSSRIAGGYGTTFSTRRLSVALATGRASTRATGSRFFRRES